MVLDLHRRINELTNRPVEMLVAIDYSAARIGAEVKHWAEIKFSHFLR